MNGLISALQKSLLRVMAFYVGISAPWVLKNEKSVADHIFSNQMHLFEDLNCRITRVIS